MDAVYVLYMPHTPAHHIAMLTWVQPFIELAVGR